MRDAESRRSEDLAGRHEAAAAATAAKSVPSAGATTGALSADSASAELDRINQELARLLDRPPAPLVSGADHARRDPLVICGILGGKDVGKSTLINTLAGQEISVDREEVGAGTSRPLVYVHRDMIVAARERLGAYASSIARRSEAGGRSPGGELQFFPHQADSIRNAVLVDLPDFDSDFRQHEAIARAVAPFLDRVIWVVTPRKIADRAWVAFARDVVKASTNIYFVLNKSDELMSDENGWTTEARSPAECEQQAERFTRGQRQWACNVLRQTGYEFDDDRLFLVAAQYPQAAVFVQRVAAIWDDPHWRRYQADRDVVSAIGQWFAREMHRLREAVLAPVDAETAAQIKEQNLRAQVRQNVLRVREHFELDHWVDQVARVVDPEYRQVLVNSAFGPQVCRTLAGRLLRARRSDVELADEVMDARAGRWPVLRSVYWLTRWAIRRLGRAMAGAGAGDVNRSAQESAELFHVRARSLADRVSLITDRLTADHGPLVRQLMLADRLPDPQELAAQVQADLSELPSRGDDEAVDRLTRDYRPSRLGRLSVGAVLLWFPFVQPVAEGMLEMAAAGTDLTDWLHGLYRVVFALGAVQLLHGILVVLIIYVAMLAVIYGKCVRDIQAVRSQSPSKTAARATREPLGGVAHLQEEIDALTGEIDALLLTEVIGPVLRPFEGAAAQLAQIRHRLGQIAEG